MLGLLPPSRDRISRSQLRRWRDEYDGPVDKVLAKTAALGMRIAAHFLGGSWVVSKMLGQNSKDKFLSPSRETRINNNERFVLYSEVGELLFNLQHVEGFLNFVDHMRTHDIESTLGELQAGHILKICGTPFRFHKADGAPKGANYDLEVLAKNGMWIPSEVKTKREDAALSAKAVFDVLKGAIGQLPKGSPSFVFLQTPPSWCREETYHEIDEGLNRFFRQTSRVVSVEIFFQTLDRYNDGIARAYLGIETQNPRGVLIPPQGWNVLDRRDANGWRSLLTLFTQ